jgi:ribonuclease HI
VQNPTEEDEDKLMRVINKYLNGTRELKVNIRADEGLLITAYIDASDSLHPDGRGHTGIVICVGEGAIYCSSTKQKVNGKSSTEAEIIGVSDGLSQLLWTKNFLEAQGYEERPAILMQDNQSSIQLMHKGRSINHRTKHMKVRYFFIRDYITRGEVDVDYLPSEDMIADYFTKPLQGALF